MHRGRAWALVAGMLIASCAAGSALAGEPLPRPDAAFKGKIVPDDVHASVPDWPEEPAAPEGAPSVVLVLIDDAGFAATSLFGGPARTPNMEKLAAAGLRYNRFHVTAICSPTRAALLSGRNDHRVGFGTIADSASGFPGYSMMWRRDSASIAKVLHLNGYSTAAFGKWHNTPFWEITPAGPFDRWPTGLGFDHFYGFMAGDDSQWEPALYRDTTPVEPSRTPEQGYHFTTDIADEAIGWLHTHESLAPGRPYFLYFATGATHTPHHVSQEWIAKYRGQFDQGWDRLREQIFARQKRLGVVPQDTILTPRPAELPAWDSFSPAQQKLMARQMEVYAAFMEHTDHEIGRLIDAARQGPGGDNTLIFVIAGDNGSSAEGGIEGNDQLYSGRRQGLEERESHVDRLGSADFYNHYSAGWAWAMTTPFQWMKQIASHLGGTRDPLIVSWPARIKDHGGLRSQYTHANDVAATIYEVAGIALPPAVDGVAQQPLDGTSFAYSFADAKAPSRHTTQIFEQAGNRSIYHDGWVAAARHLVPWIWPQSEKDFDRDRWELYHLDADFSEARDLAAQNPARLKELQALFDSEARRNAVYPLGAGNPNAATKSQPSLTAGRRQIVYYGGMPRLPSHAAPLFSKSHRVAADVVIPEGGAQGVVLYDGTRFCGTALYVKNDHLVFESFAPPDRLVMTSKAALPAGKVTLGFEYVREPTGKPVLFYETTSGTARLYVNGKLDSEMPMRIKPSFIIGSLGIGRAVGSPLSENVQIPMTFSGTIDKITVDLDEE